jgi:hypothetical protein
LPAAFTTWILQTARPSSLALLRSTSAHASAMHSVRRSAIVRGRQRFGAVKNELARLIATLIGCPVEGEDAPVEVRFDVLDRQETWTRRFDDRSSSSEQFEGTGRYDRLVCERLGTFTLALALVADGRSLHLIVEVGISWTFHRRESSRP